MVSNYRPIKKKKKAFPESTMALHSIENVLISKPPRAPTSSSIQTVQNNRHNKSLLNKIEKQLFKTSKIGSQDEKENEVVEETTIGKSKKTSGIMIISYSKVRSGSSIKISRRAKPSSVEAAEDNNSATKIEENLESSRQDQTNKRQSNLVDQVDHSSKRLSLSKKTKRMKKRPSTRIQRHWHRPCLIVISMKIRRQIL